MLKWLSGSSRPVHPQQARRHRSPQRMSSSVASSEIVTDDPLATICVHKVDRPLEIYAVSRVNPIFDEEEDSTALKPVPKNQFLFQQQKDHGSPELPGNSTSSGYGSNRYNSSSEYSSSGAEEANGSQNIYNGPVQEDVPTSIRCGEPRTAILRDDAITVLEQNVGFVKSILVAVRGNNPNTSPSSRAPVRRHNRRASGASAATLSPIPEGKVDYCIPRPVWPKDDDSRDNINVPEYNEPHPVAPDSIVDDALLLYTSFTYRPPDQNIQDGKLTEVSQTAADNQTSHELLRELSNTISKAMECTQNTPPEDVLKGLSNTINLKLESLQAVPKSVSSEDALRRLSVTLSHRTPLTKMSRALSNSSGGSLRAGTQEDTDTTRLLLLQRLGSVRDQWCASRTARKQGDSSSSSTSSSGFSDPPVFLHEDLSSVPNSVRNAMIYGTLCRNGVYEKLLSSRNKGPPAGTRVQDDRALWETYHGAGVTAGDVRLKSSESYYYPSPERPDFTLDMHRAERLMRKIKSAKRRRCWCRVVTSLLGLVFFLMSVMVVSMLLTRGKRVFGPI